MLISLSTSAKEMKFKGGSNPFKASKWSVDQKKNVHLSLHFKTYKRLKEQFKEGKTAWWEFTVIILCHSRINTQYNDRSQCCLYRFDLNVYEFTSIQIFCIYQEDKNYTFEMDYIRDFIKMLYITHMVITFWIIHLPSMSSISNSFGPSINKTHIIYTYFVQV